MRLSIDHFFQLCKDIYLVNHGYSKVRKNINANYAKKRMTRFFYDFRENSPNMRHSRFACALKQKPVNWHWNNYVS